ncbi:hypothetical protein CLIB1423_02S11210 [[Candida] railenensis]|uniref:Uncharacterized protein n=1 Tax=[Candida] railenensis TaxID=45579 RepID=A0A9P0QLX1_9ASCO|nr:hypothetical protein CLIB1423_02S11210 [[Candida] railenensis]
MRLGSNPKLFGNRKSRARICTVISSCSMLGQTHIRWNVYHFTRHLFCRSLSSLCSSQLAPILLSPGRQSPTAFFHCLCYPSCILGNSCRKIFDATAAASMFALWVRQKDFLASKVASSNSDSGICEANWQLVHQGRRCGT